MPLSLYDVVVPTFQQILGAVAGLLDKAEAHCAANNLAESDLLEARLAPDMFTFSYQVKSTAVHSIGAIEALAKGVFSPDLTPPPASLAALKERIAGARTALDALTPGDLEAYEGRDMAFAFRDFRMSFTAENFLLSFSLPNFYFHAATVYDILRQQGLAIGKRDFMGQMRVNT